MGKFVVKNVVESFAWYTVAAATGHPVALDNLGVLQRALSPVQIETARNRAPALLHAADEISAGSSVAATESNPTKRR